jgi:hypothetical protein
MRSTTTQQRANNVPKTRKRRAKNVLSTKMTNKLVGKGGVGVLSGALSRAVSGSLSGSLSEASGLSGLCGLYRRLLDASTG